MMSLPLGGSQRFSDVIFGRPQLKICYVVILFSHIASPSININIGCHKILSALVQGPVKVREYHTKGLKGFKHVQFDRLSNPLDQVLHPTSFHSNESAKHHTNPRTAALLPV